MHIDIVAQVPKYNPIPCNTEPSLIITHISHGAVYALSFISALKLFAMPKAALAIACRTCLEKSVLFWCSLSRSVAFIISSNKGCPSASCCGGSALDDTATIDDEMAITCERYSLSRELLLAAVAGLLPLRISANSCWMALTSAEDCCDK